ncbi:MAG: hypothetical protein ISS53_04165 [Dehalococcoidia bacterium]|nr:hypothetical protein [Dehalococcoidia bacterium]
MPLTISTPFDGTSDNEEFDTVIKWSRNLKQRYRRGLKETFDKNKRVSNYHYRPFCKFYIYYSDLFLDEHGIASDFLGDDNKLIAVNVGNKPFNVLSSKYLVDWHFNGDSCCLPLYRYDENGKRSDNITDWALLQFRENYEDTSITKESVFHYVYAVLHHPAYREKYATNLKRELPRIPFYDNFQQWETWGRQLMNLHLNYETTNPCLLRRADLKADSGKPPIRPKPILKVEKQLNSIRLDTITTLTNIPPEAWEYKLGNRSALEWVLEYYKERKPKDPTILEKFNTYRFADYKDQVIDLLARVCAVSVETMRIIGEMGAVLRQ